jgi:hypothetical protein
MSRPCIPGANLHGAKYRDFSASRAQTREKARQRVEQAIEQERSKSRLEAEAQRVDAARGEEERRPMDLTAQQAALQAAQQAALQAAQDAQRMQRPNWPPRITPPSAPYQQQPSPIPPRPDRPDRNDRDLRATPPQLRAQLRAARVRSELFGPRLKPSNFAQSSPARFGPNPSGLAASSVAASSPSHSSSV